MSEDTKHSEIVLEDYIVSRIYSFFSSSSRLVFHQGPTPARLFVFKSQSKSELPLTKYGQPENQDHGMSWETLDVHDEANSGFLPKLSRSHVQVLGSQLRVGTQDFQIWRMVLTTHL